MPLLALLAIEFAAMLESIDLEQAGAGAEISRVRTLVHLAVSDGHIPLSDWNQVMAESNRLRRILATQE